MELQNRRSSTIKRKTGETDIHLQLILEGQGSIAIDSDVPFLDHMLTLFAVHGFFDVSLKAKGDIEVDYHHTVEDIGICLGQAFSKLLGDKGGINRYGCCYLPMDETLVRVVADLSNRPFLHFNVEIPDQKLGSFDTALTKEFLRAFVLHAGVTLHVDLLHGENSHHIIEAIFKGLGRCMNEATEQKNTIKGVLSSKGIL